MMTSCQERKSGSEGKALVWFGRNCDRSRAGGPFGCLHTGIISTCINAPAATSESSGTCSYYTSSRFYRLPATCYQLSLSRISSTIVVDLLNISSNYQASVSAHRTSYPKRKS